MLPEHAEEMLYSYRENIGRCEYLRTMRRQLEREIEVGTAMAAEDLVKSGGQAMDGMPHGTTVGNPTERMGILLASGYEPQYIQEVRKELAECLDELRRKERAIMFVEAWLAGLTEKERWVIEKAYFDRLTYNEINVKYIELYGQCRSNDSLRRIKRRAKAKIYAMAE